MDYLKNRGNHSAPSYSNGGKLTPAKLWLLILATILVISGVIFTAIEIYQEDRIVDQTERVVDWGIQETDQLKKDLDNFKF